MKLHIRRIRRTPDPASRKQRFREVWTFSLLFLSLLISPLFAHAQSTESAAMTTPPAQATPETTPRPALEEKLRRAREAVSPAEQTTEAKTNPFDSALSRTAKAFLYFMVIVCLGLAVFKKLNLNKKSCSNQELIKVLGRQQLGSKIALLVVEADGKRFFLSHNGDEVALLADLTPSFEDAFQHLAAEDMLRTAVNNS
jgi:flagellar biogenesis protein FliO